MTSDAIALPGVPWTERVQIDPAGSDWRITLFRCVAVSAFNRLLSVGYRPPSRTVRCAAADTDRDAAAKRLVSFRIL